MPITYDQPGPFAPGISSAYGAAQQFSQDANPIISAASQAAQLRQSQQQHDQALKLAYAQANAQSQDRRAALYTGSDIAQADREQQAANVGATLANRLDLESLQGAQQVALQRESAMNHAWLMQQDLSQKEQMRLQQMHAAIADVKTSNLTPEEKENQITRLRTGIDPLEQRLKASQARTAEAQAQHIENTVKRAKAIELQNRELEAKFGSEGKDVRQWSDPETGKTHFLIKNDKTGEWYNPLAAGGATGAGGKEKAVVPFLKANSEAQAQAQWEADQKFPPPIDPLTGKPGARSDENRAYAMDVLRRESRQYYAMNGMRDPQDVADEAVAAKAAEKAASEAKELGDAHLTSGIDQLRARTDLAPETKRDVSVALAGAATMIRRAKTGGKALDKGEQEFIAETIRKWKDLPPVPQQAQAPPQAAPPGSSPGAGLSQFTQRQGDTPILGPIARSAPDLPSYAKSRAAAEIAYELHKEPMRRLLGYLHKQIK